MKSLTNFEQFLAKG